MKIIHPASSIDLVNPYNKDSKFVSFLSSHSPKSFKLYIHKREDKEPVLLERVQMWHFWALRDWSEIYLFSARYFQSLTKFV